MYRKMIFISLLLILGRTASGQESILSTRLLLPVQALSIQESYPLLIEIDIQEGWHINSHKPLEEFLIPTDVSFSDQVGVTFGRIHFSKPEIRDFSFSETPMSVYEGTTYIKSSLTVFPEFSEDQLTINGTIYFQACNDYSCKAPAQEHFSATVPVLREGRGGTTNTALFNRILPQFEHEPSAHVDDKFGQVIRESNILYIFIFIFLGGLALNLTPCVYPLIPITISFFGGQGQREKSQLIIRAILYVLGMSVTYSVLGVIAALTGGLLGSALQNPIVLIFIALVLIGLALSMFGLYEIRVPQSLALIGSKNRSGYIGTFLMGLTVGLIAAPCIGPFVLGLLTYVGDLGDPIIGFWMFFILALGLGTPFLFLGIFSGAISYLPRSGSWMVWVRNLFGFVLIGMAIYFIEPLFPSDTAYIYTLAFLAILTGIYLGWIDKNKGGRAFRLVRYSIGFVFVALGIYLMLPQSESAADRIAWQSYNKDIILSARSSGTPVLIDFYADWCIPCKELDAFTFSDNQVAKKSEEFLMVKADLTHFQLEDVTHLRSTYDIKGVPTIVFLDENGSEISEIRLVGFEEAGLFLNRMERALQ